MDDLKQRNDIIYASLKLIEYKLIARTWGNVSCRLDEKRFIITPSGLDYNQTKPSDLVIVNIDDLTYDKNGRKPSSEKLVHAYAYKTHKDCNFVIHTHQPYASAICADEKTVTLHDGSILPCAAYGLPGTNKLANNVLKTYLRYKECDTFLMAKHGAIILGKDKDDALNKANELELKCKLLFDSKVKEMPIIKKPKAYLDDYAQLIPPLDLEDEEAIKLVTEKNYMANAYVTNGKPLSILDTFIQHTVYRLKYSKLRDSK